MKQIMIVFTLISLLGASLPAWALFLPAWEDGGYYTYYSVEPISLNYTQSGSAFLYCAFWDDDDWAGYACSAAGISGKVYTPFPDFKTYECAARFHCWFENGFPKGTILTFPKGGMMEQCCGFPPTWAYSHSAVIDAWPKSKSEFGQGWLQTDIAWADDPYGNRGQSTIRANGCCATCAAMQLAHWGWNVTPKTLVAALRGYSDGFLGRSGLCVNWLRLQKIYGCGYRRGIQIAEALMRNMTVQAGVRHDSEGGAGHWVLPYLFHNGLGSYMIKDPVGRGIIDTDIDRYNDPRDDGCWENDTRLLYPKETWAWLRPSSNSASLTPVIERNADLVQKTAATSMTRAQSTASSASTSPAPSETTLVDWGFSGYVAYAMTGDVHLKLKQGEKTVVLESSEGMENAETGELTVDYILEAANLPRGAYTLEITGTSGTAFEIQTYQYDSLGAMTAQVVSGTIGTSGIVKAMFVQKATAYLKDIAGVDFIPNGTQFILYNNPVSVTVKLPSGEFVVQSAYRDRMPWLAKCSDPTATIKEFSQARLQGRVGLNRTLNIETIEQSWADGEVKCHPVFRNEDSIFCKAGGYLYSKIAGKVTEIGADYIILSQKTRLKMIPPTWLTADMTISICGVPVEGNFVVNPTSITEHLDWWWE